VSPAVRIRFLRVRVNKAAGCLTDADRFRIVRAAAAGTLAALSKELCQKSCPIGYWNLSLKTFRSG